MITSLIILMMILGVGGFSLAAVSKNTKLPAWAKLDAKKPWRNTFFDKKIWLKYCLIKALQLVVLTAMFVIQIFKMAFRVAKKLTLSKISLTSKRS